jgi:hypothetical protein
MTILQLAVTQPAKSRIASSSQRWNLPGFVDGCVVTAVGANNTNWFLSGIVGESR